MQVYIEMHNARAFRLFISLSFVITKFLYHCLLYAFMSNNSPTKLTENTIYRNFSLKP